MAYLTDKELIDFGFKSLGKEVKISDKAAIYNAELISIGDYSRIDDFCVLSGHITIGRNVHLAPFCLVAGGIEGIVMEDFVGAAYHVQIFSQSDDYSGRTMTNPTVPYEFKNETKKAVHIGRHVILGASSIVFPGVTVSEGCSTGAFTLVNKTTEPWGIYIGNPAKRVKSRHKNLLELEKLYIGKTS